MVTYVKLRPTLEMESQGEMWELLMIGLRGNLVFANRGPLCPAQCPSQYMRGALKKENERGKKITVRGLSK